MSFTVSWEPDILREFHELWAVSPDPAAVRAAWETVERLLATNPSGAGEHLSEGLWRVEIPPLRFNYTIDPDRRHVESTNVYPTG